MLKYDVILEHYDIKAKTKIINKYKYRVDYSQKLLSSKWNNPNAMAVWSEMSIFIMSWA